MIYEKAPFKFDIEKLKDHLEKFVFPLQPVFQSEAFGGWSVLSSDGSYKDGWHKGHRIFDTNLPKEIVLDSLRKENAKRSTEYVFPTEICVGYLQQVVEQLTSAGLEPHRARIIQLAAKSSSIWHRDALDSVYSVRLHIPIITNSGCYFETEDERDHLSADGSAYFLYVNRMHRVVNAGDSHRYHLVIDVKDSSNITQFHRYQDFLEKSKAT